MQRALTLHASVLAGLTLACTGCTERVPDPLKQGSLTFEPDRPMLPDASVVAPYTGDDPIVMQAQAELTTGLDLHLKVIRRTCGPTGGVCHNTKEYPDLHTAANFLQAIGASCNVQSGSYEAVFDRCERPGDRIALDDGPEREIGWLELIAGTPPEDGELHPDATTPGLHIHLDAPLEGVDHQGAQARFIRKFVTDEKRVEPLTYFSFQTTWWALDDGSHLYGQVRENQADEVQQLLSVGVVEGDANRNGTFGARQKNDPVHLIEPGNAEESYLIARLRGQMLGETIPGSRMPLANQPLSVPEMLALMCFIDGLAPGADSGSITLESGIDYAGCKYADDPESLDLLGSGISWQGRIRNILEFNCGGCHSEPTPQQGLSLKDGDVHARLLQASTERPELNLIEPGKPEQSYLWLKVTGDPSIVGSPMPLDPLAGTRRLSDAELADLRAWIEAGAAD